MNTGVPATTTPNNNRYMVNIPTDIDDDEANIYEFSTRYSSTKEDKKKLIKPFTVGILSE